MGLNRELLNITLTNWREQFPQLYTVNRTWVKKNKKSVNKIISAETRFIKNVNGCSIPDKKKFEANIFLMSYITNQIDVGIEEEHSKDEYEVGIGLSPVRGRYKQVVDSAMNDLLVHELYSPFYMKHQQSGLKVV